MWMRKVQWSPYRYMVISDFYVIQMTGGSIMIKNRGDMSVLKRHTGHKYLYTGDIHPDESVCIALEYGKHFYVYSLRDYELIKRVTLPRGFESVDQDARYTEDGRFLLVRAHRWVAIRGWDEGYYEYVVFHYETNGYTVLDRTLVVCPSEFRWEQFLMTFGKEAT